MTAYEYDGDRLVRSVPESEWSTQDVAWLAALESYERGLCQRCHQPLEETTRPEHDFNNPFATAVYLPSPGMPAQCHCCAALDRSEKQTAAQNPQHPGAMLHAVRLVPRG